MPSTVSENTNTVMTTVPQKNCAARVEAQRADADAEGARRCVTASGLIPRARRPRDRGEERVNRARANRFEHASAAERSALTVRALVRARAESGTGHRCRRVQRSLARGPDAGRPAWHPAPTSRADPQRRPRWPQRPRARRRWSRHLLVATGTITGPAGSKTARPSATATTSSPADAPSPAVAPTRHDGVRSTSRHPGPPRLRRRAARGLRAADAALFVGLGRGRRRRRHPHALGGVRRGRHAARRRRHPARPGAGRLRGHRRDLPAGVRRRRRMPLYLPLHGDDESTAGYSACSRSRSSTTPAAPAWSATPTPAPGADRGRAADLIEGIIQESEDDALLDRYLGGEEIALDIARRRPREGGRARPLPPRRRRPSTADRARASQELLEVCRARLPLARWSTRCRRSDAARTARLATAALRPGGPLVAEVVKTTTTRTSAGSASCGSSPARCAPTPLVHVSGHFGRFAGPADVTVAGPRRPRRRTSGSARCPSPLGDALRPVGPGVAGDLVAVARLTRAETGDTLSRPTRPPLMEPWVMPEPLLPTAIRPPRTPTRTSSRRRCSGWSPRTRRCGSSTTATPTRSSCGRWARRTWRCCCDRLRDRYGVGSSAEPLRVAAARDLRDRPSGHGRHVKQSGGHGQYAVCDIEVEPLCPRGRVRVRRQGRRRRGTAAVHPQRREGHPGAVPSAGACGIPDGRPAGDPRRRQGARRRLLATWRSRRPAHWPCATPPRRRASPCSSRSTRCASSSPTSTSARS